MADESDLNAANGAGTGDLTTGPAPRYARRLSDKILIAFHHACDQGDAEVAWDLLNVLEFMAMRHPMLPAGVDRRAKEGLVAAHERLWYIRNPGQTDR